MDTLFLSTAIPFVNAAPHLGHALEFVEADVLARHARARGRPTYFLTGSDEHAHKNVQAAAEAGVVIDEFVTRNADDFVRLAVALDLSNDDFLRTSSDPRHRPTVEELWRRCAANGDLYRAPYVGTYCAGCEEFRDAPCPEHDAPLERIEEENWFFRLSRYVDPVRELITSGRLRIEPPERRNEVLGFLKGEVRDLSVSRRRARVGDWGIPVPDDDEQLIYVWFDALANYISAPGVDAWTRATTRRHVIGKGIVRFHAVIWPAILLAAGIEPPTELFVHDYVSANGRKIGKSLGNAVDPFAVVDRFGADAIRWWFAREVPRVGETDYSDGRVVEAANRDLANGVGNLVQRVVALAAKTDGLTEGGYVPTGATDGLADRVDRSLDAFDLRAATGEIVDAVTIVNRAVETQQPWTLTGPARTDVVLELLAATQEVVRELHPFVPRLAAVAETRLRDLRPGAPLFERLTE